ncbi:hypothetical protein AB3464_27985 [Pseudomonas asplenii]|uniref:DUF6124 family protein n=1 Tax=Pseudomonas asplenii TaxID=53407 RepID=UPI0037C5C12E
MTKKITPDPPPRDPLDALATTAFNLTSASASKPALFAIQPGVTAKVALAHVSDLLRTAELNADEISPHLEDVDRDLFRGVLQSLELSRAIVDSLLAATKLTAAA